MIGARLRDLREAEDMTQTELGEKIGVIKQSVYKFERDMQEPSDEVKVNIARLFNVSVDYLLGMTDDPKPHYGSDENYIRLPMNFPPRVKDAADEYIDFLCKKYLK